MRRSWGLPDNSRKTWHVTRVSDGPQRQAQPLQTVGHTGRRTGAAYATQVIVRTAMEVNRAFALIERAMIELEEDR